MPKLARAAYLAGLVDLCREVGVDASALIDAAGLPAAVLTDRERMVSIEAIERTYEMAARRSGIADFGLLAGANRKLTDMGLVGLVVREQPTFKSALQAYGRYARLQNEASSVTSLVYGDQVVLRFNGPASQPRQAAEYALAAGLRMVRYLLGETWKPQEVWFIHSAPARTENHRRIFGVTPRFDQDFKALVLTRQDFEAPIATADAEAARNLEFHLARLSAGRPNELAGRVAELIDVLLPEGSCTADEVARHLAMDRRTLHRRLLAEGASFSDILDDKRCDLAAKLLVDSGRPLQIVAGLLGFSSLSAFAHWFRRKFAQSASAYRARYAGHGERPLAASL